MSKLFSTDSGKRKKTKPISVRQILNIFKPTWLKLVLLICLVLACLLVYYFSGSSAMDCFWDDYCQPTLGYILIWAPASFAFFPARHFGWLFTQIFGISDIQFGHAYLFTFFTGALIYLYFLSCTLHSLGRFLIQKLIYYYKRSVYPFARKG